jgi:hypothetical protein
MGYLLNNSNFLAKKLEITIKDGDFQLLHSTPYLIYTATGTTSFLPFLAYFTGNKNYNYNLLYFTDLISPRLGALDLQNINGGNLDAKTYILNMYASRNGANGCYSDPTRDTYLKAENADDLTGTGNVNLTVYYFEV